MRVPIYLRTAAPMRAFSAVLLAAGLSVFAAAQGLAAGISDFAGEYSGSVEIVKADGDTDPRDMSVVIREMKKGFTIKWTSTTEKDDGRRKSKTYQIEFQKAGRNGVYTSAMTRNVFGHSVPLDPMKGEPFVWGRITGDTLTVFSLFIHPNGDYEMQQYDRTLAEGGLDLVYVSRLNGEPQRKLATFLTKH
ncbi:hypothetical protein KUV26_01600 [Leisingera daeponensis]|uniref:Uncharacterized protein n=1 Tax=Leisingera daeponensis TaxID=405746 RepID=A0ABS7NA98_9RHOB|nr:hypothetical protein [Leisingera daeponensis]MBY6138121.1 hypothetical protein [Leisingera daeponensis]